MLAIVSGVLGPVAVVGIILAVVGGLGWYALGRRRRVPVGVTSTDAAGFVAWADACCPACLSLAAVEVRR